ncbi:type II toxin-antitoxin system RelE/ParE family toxin [Halalkalibaculum sp. DA3122]|uniref:type II toxin-antitoxin system RelE/ParE family toxin n=1 Tax=unclassified Halalkalibaculum TaxID=2964617 RepID=UPI003754ABCA
MIKSFNDKESEEVFNRTYSKKLPETIQQRALRKLRMIDAAADINDLRVPPGNRLETLGGDHEGQHSIRINNQWRICFTRSQGDAYDVEIVDDH